MKAALITGSCGLVGSESVDFLHKKKFRVLGVDNNLRKHFFGKDGDTSWISETDRVDKTQKLSLFYIAHDDLLDLLDDQLRLRVLLPGHGVHLEMVAAAAGEELVHGVPDAVPLPALDDGGAGTAPVEEHPLGPPEATRACAQKSPPT